MRYVEELSMRVGAKLIVKAKSLTPDERVHSRARQVGIRSVETDLGELMIQIAGVEVVHPLHAVGEASSRKGSS